jgi:type II secretory pathway predicted ATPase ExeA
MKRIIQDFYGFTKLPFGKEIAGKDLFRSNNLKDTHAMLELGIISEDILLLTGKIGCGKSTILRAAMNEIDSNSYHPVYLRGSPMSLAELYKLILLEFRVEPPRSLVKTKNQFYTTVSEMTKKPVIIIDDAQDIGEDALLAVKSMVNFNQDSQNRITFILSGQPELRTIIGYSQFLALKQRIKLSIHLNGMSLEETCGYIDHCLAITGRKSPLFSDAAKIEIFKKSEGIPRMVSSYCYQSIVQGAINRKELIDTKDIIDTLN